MKSSKRICNIKTNFTPKDRGFNKIMGLENVKIAIPSEKLIVPPTIILPDRKTSKNGNGIMSEIYKPFPEVLTMPIPGFSPFRPPVEKFAMLRKCFSTESVTDFLSNLFGENNFNNTIRSLNLLTNMVIPKFNSILDQAIADATTQVMINPSNPEHVHVPIPKCIFGILTILGKVQPYDKNRGEIGIKTNHLKDIIDNFRNAGSNLIKLAYKEDEKVFTILSGHHLGFSYIYRILCGDFSRLELINPINCVIDIYDEERFIDNYVTEDNRSLHTLKEKVTNDDIQLGHIAAMFQELLTKNGLTTYAFETPGIKISFVTWVQTVYDWIESGKDINNLTYPYIYEKKTMNKKVLDIPAHKAKQFSNDFIKLIYNALVQYENFMKKAVEIVPDKVFLRNMRQSTGFSTLILNEFIKSNECCALSRKSAVTASKIPSKQTTLAKLYGKLTRMEGLKANSESILKALTTSNREKIFKKRNN